MKAFRFVCICDYHLSRRPKVFPTPKFRAKIWQTLPLNCRKCELKEFLFVEGHVVEACVIFLWVSWVSGEAVSNAEGDPLLPAEGCCPCPRVVLKSMATRQSSLFVTLKARTQWDRNRGGSIKSLANWFSHLCYQRGRWVGYQDMMKTWVSSNYVIGISHCLLLG
jgi:hypothetical protein